MKQKEDSHIIYILTKLELGGAQKICLALFEDIQKKGITTTLITGTQGALVPTVQDKKNVTFIPSLVRQVTLTSIRQDIACLTELVRNLRISKKKYAQVLVHTHSTKAGILGRLAAWWVSVKVIHTIHGYGFNAYQPKMVRWAIYGIELLLSRCTTHYICVSRTDAKTGIRLFPGFKDKHTIIRAAVDHELFKRSLVQAPCFPQAPAHFIFGTISCFKPQKNLKDLIRAFAQVHSRMPHARFEVIGDGVERPELETLVKEYHLSDYVIFHGWQHDISPYVKRWHTFVLSSLWEGLPCAVIEARLLHIPVVCYNTGGIHEVILHGYNGFLVERGNLHMLAHHMLTLITSSDIYYRLQAYQDDFADFGIPTMIDDHTNVYRSLLKKESSSDYAKK